MESLQEATEKICDLKGNLLAVECAINALVIALPHSTQAAFFDALRLETEAARVALLGAVVSEWTVDAFDRDVQRLFARQQG